MVIAAILIATPVFADEYRKWTDEKTGKTIDARVRDKRSDNTAVEVEKRGGGTVWLQAERLVQGDKNYIKLWMKAEDHLTARVVGSGSGRKRVKITAKAGLKTMKVYAYYSETSKRPLVVRTIQKGKEIEFEFEGLTNYRVVAKWGKKVVDKETFKKKTGL